MRIFQSIVTAAIALTLVNLSVYVLYAQEAPDHKTTSPAPEERFFGQIPPGNKAVPFAPDVLIYEAHDSPIIPPDETWLLFQGMGPDVLFYGMVDGRFTAIENPLSIEFPETCNGVAISPSGNRLYIEEWKDGSTNLYYIDREGDRWTSPTYVDFGLKGNWWQISIASSGNLYLGSDKIMVSALEGGLHVKPVPLELSDNSDMKGFSPFISPDESYIIFSIDDDLHISYRQNDGKWTMPVDLGPDINSDQMDLCPQITPNGKYLLLTTRRDFPDFAIYWADAGFVEALRPKK
jgi:hypothetical protein